MSEQPPSLWSEDGNSGPARVTPSPTTSMPAVLALVFGALSFVSCPVVFAVVALVLAQNSAKEIRASGGRVTGEGLVTAARVLAWVNIGLAVLIMVIFAVWIGLMLVLAASGVREGSP